MPKVLNFASKVLSVVSKVLNLASKGLEESVGVPGERAVGGGMVGEQKILGSG